MLNTIKTIALVLGMMLATISCKKEKITIINNYQLVKASFNPEEFIVKSVSPFAKLASVTKPQTDAFNFIAEKPEIYNAYFIVGNEVIHEFNNIVEGNQEILIQDRQYDIIVVSSIALTNDQLRKYNNNNEYTQKLVYGLPVTSEKLILAGAIFDHDVRVNRSIKVIVYNAYAATIFFNADDAKTQNDISFKTATLSGIDYRYLYVKGQNIQNFNGQWNQGFKYTVNSVLFNTTQQIESNKIYKFYIYTDRTKGDFTVEVSPLFTETKTVNLPGIQ